MRIKFVIYWEFCLFTTRCHDYPDEYSYRFYEIGNVAIVGHVRIDRNLFELDSKVTVFRISNDYVNFSEHIPGDVLWQTFVIISSGITL